MRIYARGKKGILWVDTWTGGKRINVSLGTANKKEAEELAAKLTHDSWRTRKLGEAKTLSWAEACLLWMNKFKNDKKSIGTMAQRLNFLTPFLEKIPLAQINGECVEAILNKNRPKSRAKSQSNATRNRYLAEVSKILTYAHKQGYLPVVPPFTLYRELTKNRRWLTEDEAAKLIAELPAHLADMATFALATGLRESNVRLLRWDHVDLVRGFAWVDGDKIKTSKPLNVPLNADALNVLHRRRNDHKTYAFVYEGKPVTECSTRAWYKAVKRAGLGALRWHDLRHTWASWHMQRGTPPQVLKELGGWASLAMVERYGHLSQQHVSQWAQNSNRCKTSDNLLPDSADVTQLVEFLAPRAGLEPATHGLTDPQRVSNVLNLKDSLRAKLKKTA